MSLWQRMWTERAAFFFRGVGCMRLAYSLQRGSFVFVTLVSAVEAVHCRTLTLLIVGTEEGACWRVSVAWVAVGPYRTSCLDLAAAAAVADEAAVRAREP